MGVWIDSWIVLLPKSAILMVCEVEHLQYMCKKQRIMLLKPWIFFFFYKWKSKKRDKSSFLSKHSKQWFWASSFQIEKPLSVGRTGIGLKLQQVFKGWAAENNRGCSTFSFGASNQRKTFTGQWRGHMFWWWQQVMNPCNLCNTFRVWSLWHNANEMLRLNLLEPQRICFIALEWESI